MNVLHAQSVLSREGCGGGHGIAAMGGEDFLIGFKAADYAEVRSSQSGDSWRYCWEVRTYAPPELSEPAMTRTRGVVMLWEESEGDHSLFIRLSYRVFPFPNWKKCRDGRGWTVAVRS